MFSIAEGQKSTMNEFFLKNEGKSSFVLKNKIFETHEQTVATGLRMLGLWFSNKLGAQKIAERT